MVGLRAKVLGRLGRRPHPRASALSCPSLAVGGPGKSLVGQPRPAARCYCPRPRWVAPSCSAAFTLRPSALRRSVGGANMTTPGGTRTPYQVQLQPPCSAHRLLFI